MKTLFKIFKKINITPYKIKINGNITLVESNMGCFVVKKEVFNSDILNFLKSRSFDYYPNIIYNQEYLITKYIEDIKYPNEKKLIDLINLVSLLHNKTTYYKEITNENEVLYDDIKNNIDYLYSYYDDLIKLIDTHVFMSPGEYLLARNINKIFNALNFCKKNLDIWYDLVKKNKKQRVVVLHNNLKLNNFIKNEKSYLISWSKAKIGIPIFDLYKLYLDVIEYDFNSVLNEYEKNYPLKEDEKLLFFILIVLPKKIEINKNNYDLTIEVNNLINTIIKTEEFISPYYMKQNK